MDADRERNGVRATRWPAARRTVAPGVLALALAAGCSQPTPVLSPLPTPSPAVTGTFVAGAEGIGDPYFPMAGNGGYDVASYDLQLRYDPDRDWLDATATITATATAGLSRFNLDLSGLNVDRVTIDGAQAAAARDGSELVITPTTPIIAGARFQVMVAYAGVPQPYRSEGLGETGFLHTDNGAVAIGEPEVAASWFPVNDHPRDKATYTIAIAAPDDLSAISNGILRGKTSADGYTTWRWEVTKPMAPYLATVVIGQYRISESTHDGLPVFIAVDTDLSASIDAQLERSGEVIDFLEKYFGPYPFDAIGGVVIDDPRIRFALENQTRPVYGQTFFASGGDAMWVIVHELAHQWYGDSVALSEWRDIWLNEGFATYAEWLWGEDRGVASVQQAFDYYYDGAAAEEWQVKTGDPTPQLMFDDYFAVYVRGAMTLHALRLTVGDDDFFAIIKAWAAEKAYGNGTTEQFIDLAERVSGEQLDNLFDAWLYGTTQPPRP